MAGFLVKNIKFFDYKDLYLEKKKIFNYSSVHKLGIFNNYQFYISRNSQCAEFKEICVNKARTNYKVKEIYSYKIISGQ